MVICDSTKVLFVHIQKTGGRTIERILMEHLPETRKILRTHAPARYARAKIGSAYASYYRFAFVRNPWDRMVSWYSMIAQNATRIPPNKAVNQIANYNRLWHYVLNNANNFEEFIQHCTATIEDRFGRRSFCFNQLDYITDETGNVIVDDIFRFENFDRDCQRLLNRLGISAHISHENPSTHDHYSEYYSAETREIVRQRFVRDINYFGYKF